MAAGPWLIFGMAGKLLDALAAESVAMGDDDRVRALLAELCTITGMGFAALARVTEQRWIACQVLDKIDFGMDAGGELDVKTTICDDIRRCGRRIVIDDVGLEGDWRNHPTPRLYGFKSYVSLPLVLADGSFFGTLCAIDPEPRTLGADATIAAIEACGRKAAALLSEQVTAGVPSTAG